MLDYTYCIHDMLELLMSLCILNKNENLLKILTLRPSKMKICLFLHCNSVFSNLALHLGICSLMDPLQWMGAVRMRVQTADKKHHNNRDDSCASCEVKGTQSLQRIHWWTNYVMIHFSKSVLMKKQTHIHLAWFEVSTFSAYFHFWVNYSFKRDNACKDIV